MSVAPLSFRQPHCHIKFISTIARPYNVRTSPDTNIIVLIFLQAEQEVI